jgi:Bacteriophage Lambda NinG protein
MRKLKSVPKLLKDAQQVFNRYIRHRDSGLPCISCGSYDTAHASHYFSAGKFSALRFNEWNVNASCVTCNTYLHGNLIMYRMGLIKKIGEKAVLQLESEALANRLKKWDREELQEIISKYKI